MTIINNSKLNTQRIESFIEKKVNSHDVGLDIKRKFLMKQKRFCEVDKAQTLHMSGSGAGLRWLLGEVQKASYGWVTNCMKEPRRMIKLILSWDL